MRSSLTLRPIGPEDEAFLYQVYASTRTEELAVTGWDDCQKEAFLRMQFNVQHRYYQQTFPDASYQVILYDEHPVGRLYVDRLPGEISVIDIALLPEHRRRGIGSILLHEVMAEATALRKPVRIYVEQFNPALRLYQRLGFHVIGNTGVYYHMEWSPPPVERAPARSDSLGRSEPEAQAPGGGSVASASGSDNPR